MKRILLTGKMIWRALGISLFLQLIVWPYQDILRLPALQEYRTPNYSYLVHAMQVILPIQPAMWGLLFLREYLEGDGHELLIHHDRVPRCRVLLGFIPLLTLMLAPHFLVYHLLGHTQLWSMLPVLILQALFLLSLFYLLAYLFRSEILSFTVVVVCALYWLFLAKTQAQENWSVFVTSPAGAKFRFGINLVIQLGRAVGFRLKDKPAWMIWMLLCSLFMLLIGRMLEHRYKGI